MGDPGEPLVITNRALLALGRGLSQLDAVKEGDGLIGFEFNRDVSWRLVCASVAVEKALEPYRQMDRQTAQKCEVFDGMAQNDVNAQRLALYTSEMDEYRDKEVPVDSMPHFTLDELLNRPPSDDKRARKANPIPHSVLVALAPILVEK